MAIRTGDSLMMINIKLLPFIFLCPEVGPVL
jgi:hypothetical protein